MAYKNQGQRGEGEGCLLMSGAERLGSEVEQMRSAREEWSNTYNARTEEL